MARRESSWGSIRWRSQADRQIAETSGQVISDNREMVKVVCPGPGEVLDCETARQKYE